MTLSFMDGEYTMDAVASFVLFGGVIQVGQSIQISTAALGVGRDDRLLEARGRYTQKLCLLSGTAEGGLGLAGAILSADVLGFFEEVLNKNVVLAFFLPAIVYLADAVGTQTEALIVRGLSMGVPVLRVVWSELVTGLVIGAALGLVFFPLHWSDGENLTWLWQCPCPCWPHVQRQR